MVQKSIMQLVVYIYGDRWAKTSKQELLFFCVCCTEWSKNVSFLFQAQKLQNEMYSSKQQKHRHAKSAGVIFSIDWVAWGKTGC